VKKVIGMIKSTKFIAVIANIISAADNMWWLLLHVYIMQN
jgi:hypothetical protein